MYNQLLVSAGETTVWNDQSEDATLVAVTLDGHRDAFSVLVRRHHPRLKLLVYGMLHDGAATEDVLQETYLKAFRALHSFRHDARFATWIHRIAYNAVIDYTRRSKPQTSLDIDDARNSFEAQATFEQDSADRVAIAGALCTLSELQRAVVLLIDGEGFDYESAAETLGVTRGVLAKNLHQARKQIRSLLDDTENSR